MAITKSNFAYHNLYEICVSIKISLLIHNIFHEIIIFCYTSYTIIIFSSLQLTPGGVIINKC